MQRRHVSISTINLLRRYTNLDFLRSLFMIYNYLLYYCPLRADRYTKMGTFCLFLRRLKNNFLLYTNFSSES